MKKLMIGLLLFATPALAQEVNFTATLDSPESLAPITGATVKIKRVVITPGSNNMEVIYRFLDAGGAAINDTNGSYDRRITYSGTDFSDVFGFLMRCPQDGGVKIGVGLRTLIWNKVKASILTGGNDGTF